MYKSHPARRPTARNPERFTRLLALWFCERGVFLTFENEMLLLWQQVWSCGRRWLQSRLSPQRTEHAGPRKTTSCSCRLPTRCSGEVNRGEGLCTDAGPRGLRGAEARGKVVGWWGGFASGCQNVKYHSSVNVMRPQKHLTAPPAQRVSTWSMEAVKHGEQWHALWAFWYYLSRGGNCWEIFLEKQDFSKPGRTPIAN